MARWKATYTGSSQKTEMWTQQVSFFEISSGPWKRWARPPKLQQTSLQGCSCSTHGKTTCVTWKRVLQELGWSKFGKMCLPRVPTTICWWVVRCAGSRTLMRCEDSVSSQFHTCIEVKAKIFGPLKWLLNYHLGFSISYVCWQCLICLAVFWSCFGVPLEPWRSKSCMLRNYWRGNGSPKSCQCGKMDPLRSFSGGGR